MMDRTTDYAKKVVSGEILASKKNIQSAERHLRDMNLKILNYHFDVERAEKVLDFIELLPVPKTMKDMELKQFQCFIIGSLFGWVDDFGNRRFTKAYISMSRKNGKILPRYMETYICNRRKSEELSLRQFRDMLLV